MLQLFDEASWNMKPGGELRVTQMYCCVETKYLWHEEREDQQSLRPHVLGFSSQNFVQFSLVCFTSGVSERNYARLSILRSTTVGFSMADADLDVFSVRDIHLLL